MLPDLVEAKTVDSAGNVIVYIILYLIIAFGIFGTILMMSKNRNTSLGVLISIGMHRWQLVHGRMDGGDHAGAFRRLAGHIGKHSAGMVFSRQPLRFSGDYAATMENLASKPSSRLISKPIFFS